MRLDLTDPYPAGVVDHEPAPAADFGTFTGSPFVAIPFLVAAIRRRWSVWLPMTLAGLLIGALFTALVPARHIASATVLLVHPSGTQPAHAMETNLGLLQTTTVAQGAMDRLGITMPSRKFLALIRGTIRSEDLLTVSVHGPNSREASRRAGAVADAFLAFRADEFRRQSAAAVQALEERQRDVTSDLAEVGQKIAAASPDQRSDAALRAFGELLNTRASLNEQIAGLRQRIDDATTRGRAIVDNSRGIDPPTANDPSFLRLVAGNLGAGAVGGMVLGLGWVVLQAIVSTSVRRRDEVAHLLGAPVALSIGAMRGRPRTQRRRFRRHLASPQPDAAAVVRHMRRALRRSSSIKPGLLVVPLGPAWPAAFATAATAMELRDEGMNVLIVELGSDPAIRKVLDVPPDPTSCYRSASSGTTLTLAFPDIAGRRCQRDLDALRRDADVVLAVSSVDLCHGGEDLAEWATTAVAFVTVGKASATALRSSEQLLRAAGVQLDSCVLVGADRGDETVGVPVGYDPLLGSR